MSHTALARKYRPRFFADAAGQAHVSETLRSAVARDRVSHAYLFCGPRGVGKTTLARVLAMALNCADRSDEGEPCGECDSCARIWAGQTALDVIEIDAASNRGVDDARELRERAMYAPSSEGRFKVYIVDEAHMLTREAWNALLKILEEPPARVIFVFATTEPQKIQQLAAPILSRCQRFDFKRIGVTDIVSRLRTVLEREGATGSEDALRILARKADGGMRDALSLLDQVLALTGGEVEVESVRRVLGLVEDERYLDLLEIFETGRHGDVFALVQGLVDEGYDLVEFYHGLLDTFRLLLRVRLNASSGSDPGDPVAADLAQHASLFQPGDLVRMLTVAAELEVQGSLRRSSNPRILIETLLLRLSYLDRTVGLEELLHALGGAGTPGTGGGDGPGAGDAAPGTTPTDAGAGSARSALETAQPTVEQAGSEPDPGPRPIVSSVAEAWSIWLEDGRGIPSGLRAFLRTATLEESGGGRVVVHPLPGPAVDKLREVSVQAAIRSGLQRHLDRPVTLEVGLPAENLPADRRVGQEEVRQDTLRALCRQEPRLERAVQELDLELMD